MIFKMNIKKEMSILNDKDIDKQNECFKFMTTKITDMIYCKIGSKKLYERLLQQEINLDYKELKQNKNKDDFNLIWWRLLDIVEDYIINNKDSEIIEFEL